MCLTLFVLTLQLITLTVHFPVHSTFKSSLPPRGKLNFSFKVHMELNFATFSILNLKIDNIRNIFMGK